MLQPSLITLDQENIGKDVQIDLCCNATRFVRAHAVSKTTLADNVRDMSILVECRVNELSWV